MEFTLEKLISDIKPERILWATDSTASAETIQATWEKIASRNKLTATEAKSIFKVLCKKFRQEMNKPSSSWKLYNNLRYLADADKPSPKEIDPKETSNHSSSTNEEETYVELLEVKDEEFYDDEYNRSFDEVKPDVAELDKKLQKGDSSETEQEPSPRAASQEKVQEPVKEKVTPQPQTDSANEKKPGLGPGPTANAALKRKDYDTKDEQHAGPEKRFQPIPKIQVNKIVQNGVDKYNNVDAESDIPSSNIYRNFGQYVESTLNRLSPRLAAKLEIKILRSIIEVSSEAMDGLD